MSGKSGGDGNIQIYLRVRPSKKPSGYFQVGGGSEETKQEASTVTVRLPDTFRSDYVNNTKLRYDFQFNSVLPMDATQEEVFKKVGTSAVQNALDGFNSTIFAYGQTGSGKTFTITGGPEKYSDRGIIPRAISMIFNEFAKRTDVQFKAYISYLEIYNEQGYDLLDPSHETKALEELNKVHMLEDEYGNFHLKNLSMHPASTEVEALDLLFMGDTNRSELFIPFKILKDIR
jgi:kinesin family member 6/9